MNRKASETEIIMHSGVSYRGVPEPLPAIRKQAKHLCLAWSFMACGSWVFILCLTALLIIVLVQGKVPSL